MQYLFFLMQLRPFQFPNTYVSKTGRHKFTDLISPQVKRFIVFSQRTNVSDCYSDYNVCDWSIFQPFVHTASYKDRRFPGLPAAD